MVGCGARIDAVRARPRYPDHGDPHGVGMLSGLRSAVTRHARDARLVWHQHRGLQHRLPIAVGARFDDRVTGRIADFAPKAKTIIHIDIDPSSISKNVKVDIPIVGDIKPVLADMLEVVRSHESLGKRRADWTRWHQQILQWQKEKPLYENGNGPRQGDTVSPIHVLEEMHG